MIRKRHSAPKLVNVKEARSKHRSQYVVLINSNSKKKKRQQTTKQREQNYLVSFVTTERQKCKTQHKHTCIHVFLSRHVLELRGREKQHLQRRRDHAQLEHSEWNLKSSVGEARKKEKKPAAKKGKYGENNKNKTTHIQTRHSVKTAYTQATMHIRTQIKTATPTSSSCRGIKRASKIKESANRRLKRKQLPLKHAHTYTYIYISM